MSKEKFKSIPQSISNWIIRILGLFLTICWYFFYRTPINITDGNIFYRIGGFTEILIILLVLYKIITFRIKEDIKNE